MMITFIIPVKNDARRLQRCLASVAANPGVSPEVIVVDNGSTDESATVAGAAGARVLSVPCKRVGQLRNEAAAIAQGGLLAFVDADHELTTTWIAAAIDVMRPSDVGAAGALYVAPDDGTWVQGTYGALRGRTVGRADVRWLGSGNLVVRREAMHALELNETGRGRVTRELVVGDGVEGARRIARGADLTVGQHLLDAPGGTAEGEDRDRGDEGRRKEGLSHRPWL